jgi:hypothetical protein
MNIDTTASGGARASAGGQSSGGHAPFPDGPVPRAVFDAGIFDSGSTTITADSGGTIAFTPSVVYATRFPSTCGVMNPPFKDGDLFDLDIIGSMATSPYPALDVSFSSPVPPLDTPIMLGVEPFSAQANGIMPANGPMTWYAGQNAIGSGINFSYSLDSDPTEIDPGAFDSVVFTLLKLPTKDGDPFTIRLRIHFVDGKVLDETFSAPLTSTWSGCPRG